MSTGVWPDFATGESYGSGVVAVESDVNGRARLPAAWRGSSFCTAGQAARPMTVHTPVPVVALRRSSVSANDSLSCHETAHSAALALSIAATSLSEPAPAHPASARTTGQEGSGRLDCRPNASLLRHRLCELGVVAHRRDDLLARTCERAPIAAPTDSSLALGAALRRCFRCGRCSFRSCCLIPRADLLADHRSPRGARRLIPRAPRRPVLGAVDARPLGHAVCVSRSCPRSIRARLSCTDRLAARAQPVRRSRHQCVSASWVSAVNLWLFSLFSVLARHRLSADLLLPLQASRRLFLSSFPPGGGA